MYLNSKETAVVIEGDANTLSMDGGFAGVGSIDKNGANTLIFDQNADNRLFVGDFTDGGNNFGLCRQLFRRHKHRCRRLSSAFCRQCRRQQPAAANRRPAGSAPAGTFAANTVTITDLISDGSAVVVLQTNGTDADLLKITGSADGMITLDVRAAGSNPTKRK